MIQYGTTSDYGSYSAAGLAFTTTHSLAITGLQGGTYAYRIESIDANGHLATYDGQFGTAGPCVAGATTLCLNRGRFEVKGTFDAGNGNSGRAQAVALTDDTGYLWFFAASNVEAVVKVLNGCALGGHYWVFAGGLTNVSVAMSVRDSQTGAIQTYINPQNTRFQPIQDTSAFSTCP